jgi:tetratricopeptide (TPR) repeat protein
VHLWQTAARLEPGFSIPWRNLGLAAYNLNKDIKAALGYYEKAMTANPGDARLLLEQDYLMQRAGAAPEERLARYLSRREVVAKRDDLTMELMALYNRTGQPEKALEISLNRSFHPWEGGEGAVARQYATAHWLMGRKALESGDAAGALSHFKAGLDLPVNLGEVSTEAEIVLLSYSIALAYAALGNQVGAQEAFEAVLGLKSESLLVDAYKGLALMKLGPVENGRARLAKIKAHAAELAKTGLPPNYFFYGHPNPIFNEDPGWRSNDFILVVGLACLGLGDLVSAKNAFGEVLAVDPANLIAYEEFKRLRY